MRYPSRPDYVGIAMIVSLLGGLIVEVIMHPAVAQCLVFMAIYWWWRRG